MAIVKAGGKFLREANSYFLAIQELNNSNEGIIWASHFRGDSSRRLGVFERLTSVDGTVFYDFRRSGPV